MRPLVGLLILVTCSLAKAQAATCLVAQPMPLGDQTLDYINTMATELDRVGQVSAVTYSLSDPVIRGLVNDSKLPAPSTKPIRAEALEAAKVIGAVYTLWLEPAENKANRKTRGVHLVATLFRNGKQIWTDEQNLDIQVGSSNGAQASVQGICVSFVETLSKTTFKDLPKSTRIRSDEPSKGQAPIVPDTSDDDGELNDFAAVLERVKQLLASGRLSAAEMLLRDAVDAAPQDGKRRRELIDFLRSNGRTDEAIAATVASGKALGDPNLTPLAARILIDAGRTGDAQAICNEALVGNPNSSGLRLILAELRLRASAPDQALKHLETAIKTEPSSEAFALRSLCRALLGAEDGSRLDMERVRKDSPSLPETHYWLWAAILDSATTVEGPDVRALFQKAVLNRKSDEVADEIDAQERLAKACVAFLGDNPANLRYEKSHANRLLAMNLLIQSMSELRAYCAKGDEDSLSEARIDFGEMLKALENAKLEFAKESKDARNAGTDRIANNRFLGGLLARQGIRP
ncbi:MAG: tetratricopeptide repeat protein [Armatimonadota bacterium]